MPLKLVCDRCETEIKNHENEIIVQASLSMKYRLAYFCSYRCLYEWVQRIVMFPVMSIDDNQR